MSLAGVTMVPAISGQPRALPVECALQDIICQHRHLARVLAALEAHAKAIEAGDVLMDADFIVAALRYIHTFSYGIHQPAEEKFLFHAMRLGGAPGDVIDTAIAAHGAGAKELARLENLFVENRMPPALTSSAFLQLLPDQLSLEYDSLAYEEKVVLPCAVETLAATDWPPIADAFHLHEDPLFGRRFAAELVPLRRHLLN